MTKRNNNVLPFLLATAAGAAAVAGTIQYRKHKAAVLKELAENSILAETRRGPIEVAIDGKGDPVVVLHGLSAGYTQGLTVGEALVDAGYQVIAVSRFGYLKSPLPEDASPAAQADLIAALLDKLAIKQAVIIGLSAGGPTAVEFAARHPDRTRALIMLSTVTKPRDPFVDDRTMAVAMFEYGSTNDVTMWLTLHYDLRSIPFVVFERPTMQALLDRPDLMAMYRRLVWGLWPVSNRRAGIDNDLEQIKMLKLPFKKIAAPTLIMHGTADQLVPYATGEYTAKHIPGAKFLRVEGGEHAMFVTQYDAIWPEIIGFIKSTKKPAAKKPAAKKPAAKKATAKKPAAKKPPAKSVVTKPVATPTAQRPAPRSSTTRRRTAS